MSTIWLLENYSKAKTDRFKDGIQLRLSMKLIAWKNVKTIQIGYIMETWETAQLSGLTCLIG